MTWDQDCMNEITGAADLEALAKVRRRLSVLVREAEEAERAVAAAELRAVGLQEFLKRHGNGVVEAPAEPEPKQANGESHKATAKTAKKGRGGDATASAVLEVLGTTGKKGINLAALMRAVGRKRVATALAELHDRIELRGGRGLGRVVRLKG